VSSKAFEVNFDGLVGPTHNYSGLSYGNIASLKHQSKVSNPREAALQGLGKMKALMDLGLKQAVLPPQERPQLSLLRKIGFTGTDETVIKRAATEAPAIFRGCVSASSMWAANSATMAPSFDTADGLVHFTAANLSDKFHRSLEREITASVLKTIFADQKIFAHHSPLPSGAYFGDEGAANHTRFAHSHGKKGIHFFVFGRYAFQPPASPNLAPRKFPGRQTFEASQAVARLHQLDLRSTIFAQQNPEIIDAGVFHNDVAAVGNENVLLFHEKAYVDSDKVKHDLKKAFETECQGELQFLEVHESEVSVDEAVRSYLFNSQLVSLPSGGMALIAPEDCERSSQVRAYLERTIKDSSNPIDRVLYFNLRQSMSNGGGPACLRLRVVLSEDQIARCSAGVFLTDALYLKLKTWVEKHYREELPAEAIFDPALWNEGKTALDELTQILGLGSLYDFQKG
jgi:succinylarginine dihydrolase